MFTVDQRVRGKREMDITVDEFALDTIRNLLEQFICKAMSGNLVDTANTFVVTGPTGDTEFAFLLFTAPDDIQSKYCVLTDKLGVKFDGTDNPFICKVLSATNKLSPN